MGDINFHTPVLLQETLKLLSVKTGGLYIDCTVGGGGHAHSILTLGGKVLGLDVDQAAIGFTKSQHKNIHDLTLVQANFTQLSNIANKKGFSQVDGILFDLGVSSHQLDTSNRGFSFSHDAPLDMRADKNLNLTAKDLLAALSQKELTKLFSNLGGETRSKSLARVIVASRKQKPIQTTTQLANLVEKNYPGPRGKIHPATKIFQALRIAVNDELNNLKSALPQTINLLKPGGRLVIISFHQGEDKIVKNFLKHQSQQNTVEILTPKPIKPSPKELANNPRSRSARSRAAQKN